MKKGERLAESSVGALSYYTDNTKNIVFFTGIVHAQMKKVSYSVRVAVDLSGEIKNANCDCPAGKGSTSSCKHVTALLLLVADFVKSGGLAVAGSCTDQLQTFKKPRLAHDGKPVPAEELGRGVPDDDDDPRPLKYRNRDCFMPELLMATVNYTARTNVDVSWRYTFGRADLRPAMQDHDYLKKPFVQY